MSVILIKKVRIAFPDIFVAKSVNGGEARFGSAFAIEPDSENAKLIRGEIIKVSKAKWKENYEKILLEIERKDRITFGERELTNSEGKVVQGFEGMYFLKAYNKTRPTVIDKDKSPLVPPDGKIYGGCYVNATIDVYAQATKDYGNRVNFTLTGVQFQSDGDAFGGGAPASPDQFPDLEDGADDDLM